MLERFGDAPLPDGAGNRDSANQEVVLAVNGLPARGRSKVITVAPIASMQVIQNTIAWVVSVRPMIFTRTDENA